LARDEEHRAARVWAAGFIAGQMNGSRVCWEAEGPHEQRDRLVVVGLLSNSEARVAVSQTHTGHRLRPCEL
jgi:hypothetical protein